MSHPIPSYHIPYPQTSPEPSHLPYLNPHISPCTLISHPILSHLTCALTPNSIPSHFTLYTHISPVTSYLTSTPISHPYPHPPLCPSCLCLEPCSPQLFLKGIRQALECAHSRAAKLVRGLEQKSCELGGFGL